MNITATVERAGDGTYTALAVIGEHSILGTGDTKDAAIEDVRRGTAQLFEYLKNKGKALPEVVGFEVAA